MSHSRACGRRGLSRDKSRVPAQELAPRGKRRLARASPSGTGELSEWIPGESGRTSRFPNWRDGRIGACDTPSTSRNRQPDGESGVPRSRGTPFDRDPGSTATGTLSRDPCRSRGGPSLGATAAWPSAEGGAILPTSRLWGRLDIPILPGAAVRGYRAGRVERWVSCCTPFCTRVRP